MPTDSPLDRGRRAYELRAWHDAWTWLHEADVAGVLGDEDLERLAWSAALTARDAEALAAFERLHHRHLRDGNGARAARAAFWVGMRLSSRGEHGAASGWFGRARREVEGIECVEHGYLLLPAIHRHLGAGHLEAAEATAGAALELGLRHGEADLTALARNLRGRALVQLGRVSEGRDLMDAATAAALGGELSPLVTELVS